MKCKKKSLPVQSTYSEVVSWENQESFVCNSAIFHRIDDFPLGFVFFFISFTLHASYLPISDQLSLARLHIKTYRVKRRHRRWIKWQQQSYRVKKILKWNFQLKKTIFATCNEAKGDLKDLHECEMRLKKKRLS